MKSPMRRHHGRTQGGFITEPGERSGSGLLTSGRRVRPLAALVLSAMALGWSAMASASDGDDVAGAEDVDASAQPADTSEPKRKVLPRPPNKPRPSRAAVNKLIDRYAKRYGLEVALVDAVVRAESAYDAHAVSHAGAVGLMQVMPATAADYGVHSVAALFNPETNVRTGTRHLKRLVSRYGIGKAVMAYNAGEGALQRHGGFVTYSETQRYTHRVLTTYLSRKGVSAYSDQARQITGITLSPAMASAGASRSAGSTGGVRRPLTPREQARRLRNVDLSTLSLKVRPSLTDRALDPSAHDTGPESQPMFVLDRPGAAETN